MKVVSAETMQQMDRAAIDERGIGGLTLMENAGQGCAEIIAAEFGRDSAPAALVIAGKGNNGGDGYVIARLLVEQGWAVRVVVLAKREKISGDAAVNLDRLNEGLLTFCTDADSLRSAVTPFEATVIVDALFGTGLKSTVIGIHAEAIRLMNESGRPVVAVDMPSGIHGSTGEVLGTAVQAVITVTFASAKIGHVLFPGAEHVGRLEVVDIGIPSDIIAAAPEYEFIDRTAAARLVKRRSRTAHKGSFGHVLIVAGSTGKTGAAAMAANSAVRTGSGLVTLAVPASLNPILEVKTTEPMTLPLGEILPGYLGDAAWPEIEREMAGKDALAIGPGISRHPETAALVRRLVEEADLPLVVDADGLNAVAADVSLLKRKKSRSVVLTPHPGEMARLTGKTVREVEADRVGCARSFAAEFGVHLILKGARTVVATPQGDVSLNSSGNPGMASGGMGDVLTGVVVSLLGQGYDPAVACRLGVFLHGLAADLVAADKGEAGISAVDVQERLPYACKELISI